MGEGGEITERPEQESFYDVKIPSRLARNLVKGIGRTVNQRVAKAYNEMGAEGLARLKSEDHVVKLHSAMIDQFDEYGRLPDTLLLILSKSDLRNIGEAYLHGDNLYNQIREKDLSELKRRFEDSQDLDLFRRSWQSIKNRIRK